MFSCTSMPVMWNHGTTPNTRSSGVWPSQRRISSQFTTRLPWVSSAPFGTPVVPEVYWRSAVSASARRSGVASGGELPRTVRKSSVAEAAPLEPTGESIARLVELAEGELAAVEDERGLGRRAAGVPLEDDGERLLGQPDPRLVEPRRPVRLPDPLHGF